MTKLNPEVRTYKRWNGDKIYVGRIEVVENDRFLYSHSTAISRLTKEDALLDAIYLKNELETQNNI